MSDPKVVVLENDKTELNKICARLEENGYKTVRLRSLANLDDFITKQKHHHVGLAELYPVFVIDFDLSDGTGQAAVRRIREGARGPTPLCILVSGIVNEEGRRRQLDDYDWFEHFDKNNAMDAKTS